MTAVLPGSWSIDPDQEPGSTVTLLTPDQGGLVRRTVLPGGLRIITEHVPGVRSAAFGIWVGVGSRDESHAQMGSAHYLEHLLFKGTRKREAMEISSLLDSVGGEMNAFTSKEHTCFYARVLDRDLPLAIDVISDIVTSALIRAEDVDAERGVILEEIAMRDDDPSDLVHDEFMLGMYGETDLGRSILGTHDTIAGITRDAIDSFYRERYKPHAMVVSAAGAVDHDEVVRLVTEAFRSAGALGDPSVRALPARRGGLDVATTSGVRVVSRPTEQAHLVVGVPGRGARRQAPLHPEHPEHGSGRGDVLATVPGDPRTPRPGVLGVRLQHRLLRRGPLRRLRRVPSEQGRPGARAHDRRSRRGRPQRPDPRGARARQGPEQGLDRPRPRGHRLPDEPHRQRRPLDR